MMQNYSVKKPLLFHKKIWLLLSSISLLMPFPSWAFTTDSSEGEIEFSVRPVTPVNPPVRQYDGATTLTSLEEALLSPSRGYPLIDEFNPNMPVQRKKGAIASPLSDEWNLPVQGKGEANVTVQAIAFPSLAGIIWSGRDRFLDDIVDDEFAVRNASFGAAHFTTTLDLFYTELAFLNMRGGIYTDRVNAGKDAWVTGSIIGKFGGKAVPHTLEILYGFDGAGRGREDFITAFLDGVEQTSGSGIYSGSMLASEDKFATSGLLLSGDIFRLKVDDKISIEGTFTCVAFNGYCGGSAGINRVPVPSSILGTVAVGVLGAGTMLRRKLRQKKFLKQEEIA